MGLLVHDVWAAAAGGAPGSSVSQYMGSARGYRYVFWLWVCGPCIMERLCADGDTNTLTTGATAGMYIAFIIPGLLMTYGEGASRLQRAQGVVLVACGVVLGVAKL